jgi:tRNA (guanine37-N1)-methyltransferase
MKADILTIFPGFFSGPLDHGITRRACEMELAKIEVHDLRKFTHDRHRTVDDRPFGGGEGMVLKPEPLFECLETLQLASREDRISGRAKQSVILLSAQGQRFTQQVASELAGLDRIVLVCGRYEGVDERVADFLADRELSIGDYVLSGGELAAMVVIEAVARLLPGTVGCPDSLSEESFAGGGGLEPPLYTRPASYEGREVPDVLRSGDHAAIARWRREQSDQRTRRLRPDLLRAEATSGVGPRPGGSR